MKVLPLLISIFIAGNLFSQKNEEFPINPQTGKIAIIKIIELNGKSRKSIYDIARSYVDINKNDGNHFENEKNYYKKKKQPPQFFGILTQISDSILVYDMRIKIFVEARLFSSNSTPSNSDFVNFKLNFYIKDGKTKFEMTNFSHYNDMDGIDDSGGSFDNPNPSWKKLEGKKRWKLYRTEAINRANYLAADIEKYLSTNQKSQFDF